jgi:hypothetical protein
MKDAVDVIIKLNDLVDSIDDIDVMNVCDIVYNLDDEHACELDADAPSCQQWYTYLIKLYKFIRWVARGTSIDELKPWVKDLAVFAVTQSLSHLKYPTFCTNYRPDP